MKRYIYMLALFLLITPVAGQKTQTWRNSCREACGQKLNTCLQEARGDGPKKQVCYWNYRGCLNWCANPPRKA